VCKNQAEREGFNLRVGFFFEKASSALPEPHAASTCTRKTVCAGALRGCSEKTSREYKKNSAGEVTLLRN
jgi:hypothetical protein